MLCAPDEGPAAGTADAPAVRHAPVRVARGGGVEFHLAHGDMIRLLRASGFEVARSRRARGSARRADARVLRLRHRRLGAAVAGRGDLEGAEGVSAPPAAPLLLASTSPQRRAILEQLGHSLPRRRAAVRGERPARRRRRRARARARAGEGAVGGGRSGRASGARRRHRRRARRHDLRQAGRRDRRGADARGARGPDARRRLGALPRSRPRGRSSSTSRPASRSGR